MSVDTQLSQRTWVATGISWVKAEGVASHPPEHRRAHNGKSYPPQNVSRAEVEAPGIIHAPCSTVFQHSHAEPPQGSSLPSLSHHEQVASGRTSNSFV